MKIETKDNFYFLDNNVLTQIFQQTSLESEKIGFLFYKKISNTNEFIIDKCSSPENDDVSLKNYCQMSKKHVRKARKLIKSSNLGNIGYWHTHPISYGSYPSSIDFDQFEKISYHRNICLFLIAIDKCLRVLIYENGHLVHNKEEKWDEKKF